MSLSSLTPDAYVGYDIVRDVPSTERYVIRDYSNGGTLGSNVTNRESILPANELATSQAKQIKASRFDIQTHFESPNRS